ncbi:HAMP domain-containing protein [Paenibacillaceae bacterium]|nr:HAMP domain-containing protein [Paenibacillaceae bacterium]
MRTIHQKIISLSVVIWIIILLVWLLMIYSNQKTIEAYNEILQRYMLIEQISESSQSSIHALNQYLINSAGGSRNQYLILSRQLKNTQKKLLGLRNQNNYIALMNYDNMINNQLESMQLAASFSQNKNSVKASYHFDEAASTSNYIAETTLSLIRGELTTYGDFYREIIQQSNNLRVLSLWTLVVTSIIISLLFYKFSKDITRPILTLTVAAREIARGNFERSIDIRTNDEFNFLASTLNTMRRNLKNLIAEMQIKAQMERDLQEHKLLLKESELKSLQSQINPHFLFNTLNTLSKKAYLEGAMETSELIISVSDLLRYNLKSLEVPTTLRNEMQGLEDYLAIQKARFEERAHYSIEIDQQSLPFKVPSLTLQPFVENAFIHAIEPFEEGGEIAIRVRSEPEGVVIEIEDNGPGIPHDTVQLILAGQRPAAYKGHSTGIGINNVIRRLRLFYGTHDIIEVESGMESVHNRGTRIILRLPNIDNQGGVQSG